MGRGRWDSGLLGGRRRDRAPVSAGRVAQLEANQRQLWEVLEAVLGILAVLPKSAYGLGALQTDLDTIEGGGRPAPSEAMHAERVRRVAKAVRRLREELGVVCEVGAVGM